MPLCHTRNFRIRYYECDAFGHLNNANYLRFMQETAFDASAAAGYDLARYTEMGNQWWIRETDIEYLQPVKYGDTVAVTTWVKDFLRVRSQRAYEFRLVDSDTLVARGVTDWIFLDSSSNRPATIPPELMASFFPEGVPDKFPPRTKFPDMPSPPAGVFQIKHKVAFQDIDSARHLNNSNYLSYIEECAMQVIAAHQWPVQRMLEEGIVPLFRRHQIQYLQPAVLDDELVISTWITDIRRSSAVRHFTIHRERDNALLTQVHTLGVMVDLASQRLVRFPEQMLADFAPNIGNSD